MALFKISKGDAKNLSAQPKTEGYCWFTTDDGKFYIDVSNSVRQILNAGHADSADKASQDAKGRVIDETYETKTDANKKLESAKAYADTAASNAAAAAVANKQNTITGAATTVVDSNLTKSRVLVSNTSGKIAASSSITTTELGYLDGVTSKIQTQLNGKASTAEASTSAAGLMSASDKTKLDGIESGANNYSLPTASSTLGGVKTTSQVTDTTGLTPTPIIDGVPYYKDTNTVYTLPAATSSALGGVKIGSNITNTSGTISLTKANVTTALGYTPPTTNTTYGIVSTTADGLAPKRDGSTAKFLRGDGTWAVPPDTDTTYSVATTSAAGLMSTADKSKLDGIESRANNYSLPTASSTLGGVKTTSTVTSTSGLTPTPIINGVPYYKNTVYSLPTATSSALGGVKIGSNITNTSGTISLTKDNVVTALGYTPPQQDTNTTYSNMTGATSSAAGKAGLVPAPAKGKQTSFLRGDGTWVIPTNTTYSNATTSAAGLMSASDKSKLDGIESGANAYTHPTSTGNKHIPSGGSSGQILRWFADGTAAWGDDKNTTYSAATQSTSGLMSAADKIKLDGISTGANAYSLPTASSTTLGGVKTTSSVTSTSGLTACPIISGVPYYKDTNTTYTLPTATSSVLGGVKIGSNITNTSGTISLTKDNVTTALGYTPPTTNTTYSNMTGATSSAAGKAGLVPAPAKGEQGEFLRGDGTWAVPTNTTYSNATTSVAGLMSASDKAKLDGIATGANAYSLPAATSGVLGGVKTGSNITNTSGTISLTKANVTAALGYTPPTTNTTYSTATQSANGLMSAADKKKLDGINTSNYLKKTGDTMTGYLAFTEGVGYGTALPTNPVEGQLFFLDEEDGEVGIKTQSSTAKSYVLGVPASDTNSKTINYNTNVYTSGSVLYGAAWNDYAEYRAQRENIEPGYCVASADNGEVYKTTEKFQACDGIVSDTYGFVIGQTENCKTPLAVAGRVLAYCEGDRYDYHAGDTVCAGPQGKVCKMTREEICEWPDRIVGIVSEIPEYETWGETNISVNNRIWIKVK